MRWHEFNRRMREYEKEILALSIGEVKRRCESLLSDTRLFKCVESTTGADAAIDYLAPYLRELFSRYETIEAIYGDARLGRREIAPSELDSRFIRIGTGIEHTQLIDVKNGVYVIYDSEGRLLEASVVKKKIMGERVVLKDREQAPKHQAELRDLLIEFLSTLGESKESLAACSLSQLVEKGSQFKTE